MSSKFSLLAALGAVVTAGVLGLALRSSATEAAAGPAPEPSELVTVATAAARTHRGATTAVGTVLALRSITLQNEVPGTVEKVALTPGAIVEPGAVLLTLDASVEAAELQGAEARAKLAGTQAARAEKLRAEHAVAEDTLDRARAERDVAEAQVRQLKALLAKKVLRAPFRARIGLSDVHPGQYLTQGVELTTLQGVADAAYVDFTVPQDVAAQLAPGTVVTVGGADAHVVAVDARVDAATRTAAVRAKLPAGAAPSPGSSVRVSVPVGAAIEGVTVPASAVRKGPEGDRVWVLADDGNGALRAKARPVTTGAVLGDEVLVLSGLTSGEQVAASGSFKLREGLLVRAAPVTASR